MNLNRRAVYLLKAAFVAMMVGALSNSASAGGGEIGPVYLERVAIIAVNALGHVAGNMEIKVKGGFTLPSGVSCDTNYITTLKTVDVGSKMFTLATAAQISQKPIYFYITDDSNYSAFGGRCSLIAADIAQ